MTRLIEIDDRGYWHPVGVPLSELSGLTKAAWNTVYGCLERLKDYEELGLEPMEVRNTLRALGDRIADLECQIEDVEADKDYLQKQLDADDRHIRTLEAELADYERLLKTKGVIV